MRHCLIHRPTTFGRRSRGGAVKRLGLLRPRLARECCVITAGAVWSHAYLKINTFGGVLVLPARFQNSIFLLRWQRRGCPSPVPGQPVTSVMELRIGQPSW